MKSKVGFLALILIISTAFSGCKKDDHISPSNAIINTIVIPGDWKVGFFNKNSSDETSRFKEYSFRFNNNGTISAIKNGTTINGAWSTTKDKDRLKMIIYFSEPLLDRLNGDWRVENQTSTTLEMQHFPGENDGIDYLTFQKK